MIEIMFQNGDVATYTENEYTEYKYDGKYFIVIKENKWIGLYNLNCLKYVEIK